MELNDKETISVMSCCTNGRVYIISKETNSITGGHNMEKPINDCSHRESTRVQ